MAIIPAYPTMGIREFKANLSAVLKRVQKGERITITHHDTAIADLMPPAEKPVDDLTWEEAKAKLDKLYGPRKKLDLSKFKPADIPFTGPSLSDILLEDRGERF